MSVLTAPCEWPIVYPSCPDGQVLPDTMESLPASGVAMYEDMATEYLWRWTGKVFGLCEITVRPCRQDCTEGMSTFFGSGPRFSGAPWTPVLINGLWYNVGCGRCSQKCGCTHVEQIELPGPVVSITSVTIDGAVLDNTAYRVDESKMLVRLDGGEWPKCQDLSANPGEPNTWEVEYSLGIEVPVGGQVAAGVLAVEFAKAACQDPSCQLPKRLQTISRQGVSMAFLDAFDDIDKGHTGIWIIDSWMASVNKAPPRSRVLSPDLS